MTDPRSVLAEALREVHEATRDRPYGLLDVPDDILTALSERGYTIVASDRLAALVRAADAEARRELLAKVEGLPDTSANAYDFRYRKGQERMRAAVLRLLETNGQ